LKGSSPGKDHPREKVIIFLTDGEPNDAKSDIMKTIKTKNAELNNAVVIMTYGMLTNLQILDDIAKQDGSSYGVSKAPDVTVSTITTVSESHISLTTLQELKFMCMIGKYLITTKLTLI